MLEISIELFTSRSFPTSKNQHICTLLCSYTKITNTCNNRFAQVCAWKLLPSFQDFIERDRFNKSTKHRRRQKTAVTLTYVASYDTSPPYWKFAKQGCQQGTVSAVPMCQKRSSIFPQLSTFHENGSAETTTGRIAMQMKETNIPNNSPDIIIIVRPSPLTPHHLPITLKIEIVHFSVHISVVWMRL